jgi:hypothetical protein
VSHAKHLVRSLSKKYPSAQGCADVLSPHKSLDVEVKSSLTIKPVLHERQYFLYCSKPIAKTQLAKPVT